MVLQLALQYRDKKHWIILYKVQENFTERISEILKLHTKLRETPALPKGKKTYLWRLVSITAIACQLK